MMISGWAGLEKGVESLKSLIGPIYMTDSKYHFNEIEKHLKDIKPNLQGPVYKMEERRHGFDIIPDQKPAGKSKQMINCKQNNNNKI